jgi:hypothetical protein
VFESLHKQLEGWEKQYATILGVAFPSRADLDFISVLAQNRMSGTRSFWNQGDEKQSASTYFSQLQNNRLREACQRIYQERMWGLFSAAKGAIVDGVDDLVTFLRDDVGRLYIPVIKQRQP